MIYVVLCHHRTCYISSELGGIRHAMPSYDIISVVLGDIRHAMPSYDIISVVLGDIRRAML